MGVARSGLWGSCCYSILQCILAFSFSRERIKITFYRFFNVKNAFLWCKAIFPIQSISWKYLGGSPAKFGRGRAAHFFNPYPISDQSYDFPYPTSQVMIIINKRPTDEISWLLQRALRPGAVHVSSKILVFVWN